jgi:hypothetical protein
LRVFSLLGNFTKKKEYFNLYEAKIGSFATSSVYSESAQKTLPENAHLFLLVKNPWKSWGKSLVEPAFGLSVYSEKKCGNFFFHFLETT